MVEVILDSLCLLILMTNDMPIRPCNNICVDQRRRISIYVWQIPLFLNGSVNRNQMESNGFQGKIFLIIFIIWLFAYGRELLKYLQKTCLF